MSTSPIQPILAPRWRRLVCLFYEALLLTAVLMCSVVPMAAVMWLYTQLTHVLPAGPVWSAVVLVYEIAVTFGYFALCWRRAGQTLAMKTWRLRLNGATQPLSWRSMGIRYALLAVTTAPLLPALIVIKHIPTYFVWLALLGALLPYLWAYVDKRGQFLHDRLAGTQIELTPLRRE